MHPVFNLGPLEFPAYFTFLTLGYTLAVLLAHREALKIPHLVSPVKFIDLSMILLFAGLLGARIMHVLADGYLTEYINLCLDPLATKALPAPEGFRCVSDAACEAKNLGELCNLAAGTCHQGQDCLRALKFWYGGLAFYGGLLLASLVAVWYMRRFRAQIQFPAMADLAGFGIALGLVFGRLGCWLAGCCFGCVAHGGPAVNFPKHSPAFDRHVDLGLITKHAHESLPVIPVQLYQLGANLLVFLAVFAYFKTHKQRDGRTLALFLMLNAVTRFILEYWRDDYRGLWFTDALSSSQLVALPLFALGLWFYLKPGVLKKVGGL
jgi:phosphatidylglycerol:prolipoprotein diacylglycerol transferase